MEIALAGVLGVCGGAAWVGKLVARARTRRLATLALGSERALMVASPTAPSAGPARRVHPPIRSRHDYDLMIGRTLYH